MVNSLTDRQLEIALRSGTTTTAKKEGYYVGIGPISELVDNLDANGKLNKESKGKLLTYEIDAEFMLELAKVMSVNKVEWGGKYERGNFRDPINPILLLEAMERHLLVVKKAMQQGESMIDSSDGCNHLGKIAANAMMLFVQIKDNKELKKW